MNISQDDAQESLSTVQDVTVQTHKAIVSAYANPFLILWGLHISIWLTPFTYLWLWLRSAAWELPQSFSGFFTPERLSKIHLVRVQAGLSPFVGPYYLSMSLCGFSC